ncbi:alpha/beta hydrolase [Actinokineospora sp. G85]|uniref:alpha/beta hydrolase n=1 Tax=Actinokineospora sp. G85 TaxID=3406626 RepID=UPI003C77B970
MNGVRAVLAAPVVAARLAHGVCHPPRLGRGRDPADVGLTARELVVPTPGGQLRAWLFAGDPDRVVVIGHGIGLDRSRGLAYARFLVAAGCTVVALDFRNHGSSFTDPALTGYGERFAEDVVAVVRHVRELPEHSAARVALYGFSMSSFAVVHALDRAGDVDAVVCDSGPVVDPGATVRNMLRSGLVRVPAAQRTGVAGRVFRAVFSTLAAASTAAPGQWPPPPERLGAVPMLFIVGEADVVVTVAQVREFAAPFPRARVLVVPRAGHMGPLAADPDGYRDAVLAFLGSAIGAPGGGRTCDSA